MADPSEAYFRALALTQGHHARQNKTFSGQFTWKLRHQIKEAIDRHGCTSVLDFGCGKGKQYDGGRGPQFAGNDNLEDGKNLEQFWGIVPHRYDPGVPAYAADPEGQFDLVICVQVLASIPRADLGWAIDRLYGYATKAVFVAERIKVPHKQIFASMAGEMPHGDSAEQWLERLRRPGSPVRLICAFHEYEGEIGRWRTVEPEDQGRP